MKSVIKQDKSSVSLTIELEEKDWKDALEQAAKKISQTVEIKGFRVGKAPLDAIINHIGEGRVLSEASDIAVSKFYALAAKEHNLIPITPPKITVEKVGLDQPLIFKVEVATMPKVELGDYKKIKVSSEPVKIDKNRIEKTLADIQRRAAKFKEVDRVTKKGDWVEIDFEGKLDGVPFDGGTSKNHPMIIGDGVFLPDFEAALVGLKAGEDKNFDVTFPKDYHQKNLAGKKTTFATKIHKVKEIELPPIDDDLAKSLGQFNNLEALKKDIEKWLTEEANKKEQERQKEKAIEELIKITKVDIPNELIDQEVSAMVQDMTHQLSHQKMTLEDYLKKQGITEDEMREQWREMARKRVIAGLSLDAFKKSENIITTEEEIIKEIDHLKQLYPDQKEQIEKKYASDLERKRMGHLLSGQKAVEQLWKMTTQ